MIPIDERILDSLNDADPMIFIVVAGFIILLLVIRKREWWDKK